MFLSKSFLCILGNQDSGPSWQHGRDSRSVEPSGPPPPRQFKEKIQSKPPSGRRHSTAGFEPKIKPLPNLPPRLQRKLLEEKNMQMTTAQEDNNWDGSTLTFKGHNNNFGSSFHHMAPSFNSASSGQSFHNHNQNMGTLGYTILLLMLTNFLFSGYHTLPNKQRGRGRFTQDYESRPMYRSVTPEVRSPSNSRPPTPPLSGNRRNDSRPHTPVSRNLISVEIDCSSLHI